MERPEKLFVARLRCLFKFFTWKLLIRDLINWSDRIVAFSHAATMSAFKFNVVRSRSFRRRLRLNGFVWKTMSYGDFDSRGINFWMKHGFWGKTQFFRWKKSFEMKHDFDHPCGLVNHRRTEFFLISGIPLGLRVRSLLSPRCRLSNHHRRTETALVGQTEPTSLSFQGKSRLKGKQAALHSRRRCLTMITERGTPKWNRRRKKSEISCFHRNVWSAKDAEEENSRG